MYNYIVHVGYQYLIFSMFYYFVILNFMVHTSKELPVFVTYMYIHRKIQNTGHQNVSTMLQNY